MVRVAGSQGEGRTPTQAPPSCRDPAQLEAGPGRGQEAGTGPQEAEPRLSDLTPPARSSPREAALTPTLRHLSKLGWQGSPRTDLQWRERAPRCSAVAQTRKVPGDEGTQDVLTALPVRRQITGTRCCRRCGPRAPNARAQPAAPWSSSREGEHSRVRPLLGSCSHLPRGLRGLGGGRRRDSQRARAERAPAGQGCAEPPRPLSRPEASEPGCFEWERVPSGWGRYL